MSSSLLRYKEKHCVREPHETGVIAVAFSLRGEFVATAGLDGRVCIWDVNDYRLVHVYRGEITVLSLCWIVDASAENSLILGFQDGNVGVLTLHAVSPITIFSYGETGEFTVGRPDHFGPEGLRRA